ncbi:hypothetical protein AwDysgo_03430 [Bacteroidales bacterium]|nr:hypothetical protein AwDysgo_03430 [Bacteroidales bacterium]
MITSDADIFVFVDTEDQAFDFVTIDESDNFASQAVFIDMTADNYFDAIDFELEQDSFVYLDADVSTDNFSQDQLAEDISFIDGDIIDLDPSNDIFIL